jgi:alpha-D-ribose 1-methylphosphonate 5-triphosphate synthase subunit PhnL
MAWIDWDAVITALDNGRLPASGGEQRIVRIAASLAAGHPVSLRDAIPGLDQRSLNLVVTAIRHAAGQRR